MAIFSARAGRIKRRMRKKKKAYFMGVLLE